MKTIAITIDEPTLKKLELLEARENRSRSEIVREAVQEYVALKERLYEEERERGIFRRYKRRLRRQAEVLLQEQAKL